MRPCGCTVVPANLCLWPHHPFVDFEYGGIRRQTATLLFGQQIPIGPDTIGREHLGEMK
ncbi:MAG: hypothetical protein HYW07_17570, partial [Candidatus Latescibacteria bacterium]|nr:hypothetical protein [Candidatus Latescibacterota bacterium]